MPHDLGTHHLDQLIPQTASESGPTALGIVGPRVELPIRFIRVARNEIRSVHRLRRELHYQTTSRDRSNTWTMPNSTGCSRPLLRYGPTELSSMRDRWFESVSLQQRVRLSGVPRTLSAKVNLYVGIERIGSSGNFALHRSELPLVFIISSLR